MSFPLPPEDRPWYRTYCKAVLMQQQPGRRGQDWLGVAIVALAIFVAVEAWYWSR